MKTVMQREAQRQKMGTVYFRLNLAGVMDNLTRSCLDIQMVFLRTGVLDKGFLGAPEELAAGRAVVAWCDDAPGQAEPVAEWERLLQERTARGLVGAS